MDDDDDDEVFPFEIEGIFGASRRFVDDGEDDANGSIGWTFEVGDAKSAGKGNGSTIWKGSTIGLERAAGAAAEMGNKRQKHTQNQSSDKIEQNTQSYPNWSAAKTSLF